MATTRRSQEELMLKLLLNQVNENEVMNIFSLTIENINRKKDNFFNKHILPYCQTHFHSIAHKINSKAINKTFEYNLIILIRKDIKLSFKNGKYDIISNSLLLSYLRIMELLYKRINTNIEKMTGLRLVMDMLINGHQHNAPQLIHYINQLYINSHHTNQLHLAMMFVDALLTADNITRDRLLQSWYYHNERHGTPGITINTIPYADILPYNITIIAPANTISTSIEHRLLSNTTLYELLTIIMIEHSLNVDVYTITYTVGNNTTTQSQLNYTDVDYIKPLSELFAINQLTPNDIIINIQLHIHPYNNQHNNTELYYNANIITQPIQHCLSQLFNQHRLLRADHLFAYIKCHKLKQALQTVFSNIIYLQFETLINQLSAKTDDCYMLLHLLIGFHEHDISQPYIRNICPENNIRLNIDRILCHCVQLKQYQPEHSDKCKHITNQVNSNDYPIEMSNHASIIQDMNQCGDTKQNGADIKTYIQSITNINKKVIVITKRSDLEDYSNKLNYILTTCLNKQQYIWFTDIIHLIEQCNLEVICSKHMLYQFNNLFQLINQYEFNKNNYSQSYLIAFITISNTYIINAISKVSFKDLILCYSLIIDYFLLNPNKWPNIFDNRQLNTRLLTLFSISKLKTDTYAMNFCIVLCVLKSLILDNIITECAHGKLANRTITYDFNSTKNEEVFIYCTELLHSPNNYAYTNSDGIITHMNKHSWVLTVILLQLFHSHQYVQYTEKKDILILNTNTLSSLLKSTYYNKLYVNYTSLYNNTKTNYELIKDILMKMQSIQPHSHSQVYAFNPIQHKYTSELIVSETPITSTAYQLIGCIIIDGDTPEQIHSYCINNNEQTEVIKKYQLSGHVVLTDSEQIDFYVLIQSNHKCFLFYYDIQIQISDAAFNNINAVLKDNCYPTVLLSLLFYGRNITDKQITYCIQQSKNKIENNNYNINIINKLKAKYPDYPHEGFDELFKH